MSEEKNLLEKYTNDESRFVVVNGSMIHYRDEGKGPVLLLLHGAFASLHTFDAWTAIFKKDFRVIRMDLPGLGLSDPPQWKSEYGMDIYKDCLLRFLDILKIDQCYMFGSSLGGWLTWEFALSYPKRVIKQILMSPAGFMDSKSIPTPFQMARTPFINKVAKYAIKRTLVERFLLQVYGDKKRVTEALVNRYYELFSREGNPETFFRLVNGKFKDSTAKLHKITTPTLIIWGELDEWLPLNNGFKFKDGIPHSELLIYDDLGHIPMEEAPEVTAEDIKQFIKQEQKKRPRLRSVG